MNSIDSANTPLVSVVIVNYSRCDDLREALVSVYDQDYPRFETIVVDNASSDGSHEMLEKEFPQVQVIRLNKNIGMDGYSVACRAAKGEFIFQMDNDSLMPDRTVLSQVVEAFNAGEDHLAIVATRVEELRASGATIDALRERDSRRGYYKSFGYHAGGVALKKSLMDRVGYYNEDVFLYGAELFVQMQALAAGYTVCYAPGIFMIHKGSGVARSNFGVYYELRNRYWYMRHFGTKAQVLRYLPGMLMHDVVYAVHRRGVRVAVKAVIDGFKPLPASLHPPASRSHADYIAAVDATGRGFGMGATLARVWHRLR